MIVSKSYVYHTVWSLLPSSSPVGRCPNRTPVPPFEETRISSAAFLGPFCVSLRIPLRKDKSGFLANTIMLLSHTLLRGIQCFHSSSKRICTRHCISDWRVGTRLVLTYQVVQLADLSVPTIYSILHLFRVFFLLWGQTHSCEKLSGMKNLFYVIITINYVDDVILTIFNSIC